jgi:ABC-type nitrate/sulfonate/bicarbonate transport system substrate-binding protein
MDLLIKKSSQSMIRIGFVPLNDAAPFLIAQELDLFGDYGLNVQLSRELGWASIRDKVATGELTAAQSILGLPMAMFSPESPSSSQPFIAPLITSLQGNAITIAKHFRDEGYQTPRSIMHWHRDKGTARPLTFAIVSRYSSHHILIRQWLKSDGIDPDTDVNLVVLPPPQMVHHLKAGHIDGYCVGEPWNSIGIMAGSGFCVATSAEISPYHPEKLLMISRQFAESNKDQCVRLVAAVLEACRLCNQPSSLDMMSRVLARHDYLNLSPDILQDTLTGTIIRQNNSKLDTSRDFIVFSGERVNVPCSRKRNWIGKHLTEIGLLKLPESSKASLLNTIYSEKLYQSATALTEASAIPPQPSAA